MTKEQQQRPALCSKRGVVASTPHARDILMTQASHAFTLLAVAQKPILTITQNREFIAKPNTPCLFQKPGYYFCHLFISAAIFFISIGVRRPSRDS